MKIVAFMQNPWFRESTPASWIARYRDDQKFHRRVLGNSMSGKRLKEAFGELFDLIHWDNVNWRATIEGQQMVPDYDHIDSVISKHKPELIICFGKLAMQALENIDPLTPVWGCHHPNARYKTQLDLNHFAQMVKDYATNSNIRTTGNGKNDLVTQ